MLRYGGGIGYNEHDPGIGDYPIRQRMKNVLLTSINRLVSSAEARLIRTHMALLRNVTLATPIVPSAFLLIM